MTNFPDPVQGGNSGNGGPFILGDEDAIGDAYIPGTAVDVLDWDGDGKA